MTSSSFATFADLSINQPGNGYTLTASASGLAGATSNAFNITPPSSTGIVAGVITRVSNGAQITGALVEAYQGEAVRGTAVTNSSGSYAITGLAAGSYIVRSLLYRLVPRTRDDVVVTSGNTTTVNLSLNFGIAIDFPVAGTTVNDTGVLVTGHFDRSLASEVGIAVNGYVALQDGDEFATFVSLDNQTTSLTATLTDVSGVVLASHTIPIVVQSPTTEPVVTFRPFPAIVSVGEPVSFTLTSLSGISQVELDANGDGIVDFTGTTLEGLSVTFAEPGLYFPTVQVTDAANTVYTDVAIIQVVNDSQLDTLLVSKWNAMKNALRVGDTTAAASYIVIDKRASYQVVFNNLTIPFSAIDQMLGNIVYQATKGFNVEYEMLMNDGPDGTLSYMVLFILDKDGVWRISFFEPCSRFGYACSRKLFVF